MKTETWLPIVLAIAVLIVVALLCKIDPTTTSQEVLWEPVSTPPSFVGSCYGYFITEGILDNQHSFSSVWCTKGQVNIGEVRQLDWKLIPNPPRVEGPCYGYFITEGILDNQHSYSGAWCVN